MRRHTYCSIVAMLLMCFCFADLVRGDEPFTTPEKVTNAALVYWQAFSVLPDLTDEDRDLLSAIERGEQLAVGVEPLLTSCKSSLHLADKITADQPCHWEIIGDGPATLLPHLGKARLLARLMVLRARADAVDGEFVAAVEQLAGALLVARNVDNGVLVQMLVGDAIESISLDAGEQMLGRLDAPALQRLSDVLAQLPARPTFAEAMTYERDVFGGWLRPIMLADDAHARELRKQAADGELSDVAGVFALSQQERAERFEEFWAKYDEIIAAAKLPREEAEQQFKRIERSAEKSGNPLVSLLLPAVGTAAGRHAEASVRFAKFESSVKEAAAGQGAKE